MTRISVVCRAAGLIILALAITVPAVALDKVGTTSMQVLKIAMGVRGVGMGSAMAGVVNDAEAVWWNPGALTEVEGTEFMIGQVNMPADVQLNSIAAAFRWGDYQTVSVHAINLSVERQLLLQLAGRSDGEAMKSNFE